MSKLWKGICKELYMIRLNPLHSSFSMWLGLCVASIFVFCVWLGFLLRKRLLGPIRDDKFHYFNLQDGMNGTYSAAKVLLGNWVLETVSKLASSVFLNLTYKICIKQASLPCQVWNKEADILGGGGEEGEKKQKNTLTLLQNINKTQALLGGICANEQVNQVLLRIC